MSGFLLEAYCPDPKTLVGLTEAERVARYADSHVIWYYFVAIGFSAAIALLIFRWVINRIDARKEAEAAA